MKILLFFLITFTHSMAILNPKTAATWRTAFAQHLSEYQETESLSSAYKAASQAAKFQDAGDTASAQELVSQLAQATGKPFSGLSAREVRNQLQTDLKRGVTKLERQAPPLANRQYPLANALRTAQEAARLERSSNSADNEQAEQFLEQLSLAITGTRDYYSRRGWSATQIAKQYERSVQEGKKFVVYDAQRDTTTTE